MSMPEAIAICPLGCHCTALTMDCERAASLRLVSRFMLSLPVASGPALRACAPPLARSGAALRSRASPLPPVPPAPPRFASATRSDSAAAAQPALRCVERHCAVAGSRVR